MLELVKETEKEKEKEKICLLPLFSLLFSHITIMAVVVIGSGLAGVSTAHSLLNDFGGHLSGHEVILVEREEPLGLTSSASTGGYRNFFPADKNMTEFVTRSIRRMEALASQSNNGIVAVSKGTDWISMKELKHF